MTEIVFQSIPDIPRVYTALAEWLACIFCIFRLKPKLKRVNFFIISAVVLAVQIAFLELTKGLDGILWMICMTVAVGIMYFFIWLVGNTQVKDAAYCCVSAFVTAEFVASLEWQLECFVRYRLGWKVAVLSPVILIIVYAVIYLVMRRLYREKENGGTELQITDRELISYAIIGLAVFLISNVGFVSPNTPFSGLYRWEIFNVRTLIDLGGVAILYAYHVQRMDFRLRRELEGVQNILNNQYAQYQQSREAMELINYKYHDLKHHILALRAEDNSQRRNDYLDKMECEIRDFEVQNKTGNSVLDTLLTSKNMYCINHEISMTCVADGKLVHFMDTMDICSIFGNALDNAIEYEEKIIDKEKRLIHVSMFSQKNFLIIRFENYCEQTLKKEGEFPVTTKEDTRYHGFGLKSIQYTVRKYGGEVDIGIIDNWFVMKVLIPLKINENK